MITVGFAVRQVAAFLCAGTLAWDYFRDPGVLGNFAFWTLGSHFAYFQLPLRSQALPYLHPISFIGACLIPVMYLLLWFWSPSLEVLHMEYWDVSWSTVILRALLINLSPLLFHVFDVAANQTHIINAYKSKPKKLGLIWSFCSFPCLGLLFELFFPESEELNDLQGIDREEFMKQNRFVCFIGLLIAFSALYALILSKATQNRPGNVVNNIREGAPIHGRNNQ
jgi:hypothetical protein